MGTDRLGELWDAWDNVRNEPVIVRLLPTSQSERNLAALVEQDLASARATLSHRNVARIVAVGLSARLPFVVSASEGHAYPLAGLLERGGLLPTAASFSIAAQVAAALREAHAVGTSHGCLSAASVCLSPAGHLLVLDFGLRRLNWWTTVTLRPPGLSVDAYRQAEDVRELTFLLLEMVIGPGGLAVARLHGLTRQLRARLRESAPQLTPGILAAIDRALQPDPYRVPPAGDMAAAFGSQGRQMPLDASVLPPSLAEAGGTVAVDRSGQTLRVLTLLRPVMQKMPTTRTSGTVAAGRHRLAKSRSKGLRLQQRASALMGAILRRPLAIAAVVGVLAVCLMFVSLALVTSDKRPSSIPVHSPPTPASLTDPIGLRPTPEGRPTEQPAAEPQRPMVRVPDVRGLTALAARGKLAKSHLQLSSVEPVPGSPGVVMRSLPAAGRAVAAGSRVRLVIGADPERIHSTASASPP
jgi:hypothetical protein